jgi:uncharacterized protein
MPDRSVVLDASGRAAGRGAYLCADGSCWALALKKSSLERALEVPLPPDLRARMQLGPDAVLAQTIGGSHGA